MAEFHRSLGHFWTIGWRWDKKLIAASPIPLQGCANSWFVVFIYHCDTAGQRSSWRRNVYEQSEGRCSADVCVGCCLFRPQNSWSRLYASLRKVFFSIFFLQSAGLGTFLLLSAQDPVSCRAGSLSWMRRLRASARRPLSLKFLTGISQVGPKMGFLMKTKSAK